MKSCFLPILESNNLGRYVYCVEMGDGRL